MKALLAIFLLYLCAANATTELDDRHSPTTETTTELNDRHSPTTETTDHDLLHDEEETDDEEEYYYYDGLLHYDEETDDEEETEDELLDDYELLQKPKAVCKKKIKKGKTPCNKKPKTRWGYGKGECVSFKYTGCGGNNNNFKSLKACEQACEGTQISGDVCGDTQGKNKRKRCASVNARKAVRCCKDKKFGGVKCRSKNKHGKCYPERATYATAQAVCKKDGWRLCSHKELKKYCCGTGCGYNAKEVWTKNDCEIPSYIAGDRCGKREGNNKKRVCEKANKKNAVRCCDDKPNGKVVCYSCRKGKPKKGKCTGKSEGKDCYPKAATWHRAKKVCENDGRRLCTPKELKEYCCGTGCGYNAKEIWTKKKCGLLEEDDYELEDEEAAEPSLKVLAIGGVSIGAVVIGAVIIRRRRQRRKEFHRIETAIES